MGRKVRLRVTSANEVNTLLTSLPLDLVIDRVAASPWAYQPLLETALAEHPEQWRAVQADNLGQRFAVFRRTGGLEFSQVETMLKAALPEIIP